MTSPDFIEVYDDMLDATVCRRLLERFESSGNARRGEAGSGVDLKVKDSWDIPLELHPGWNDVAQLLNNAVLVGLKRYVRKYAHVALAPLRLQLPDPATGQLVAVDARRVAEMDDALLGSIIMTLFRTGPINLQKYLAGQGGYPYWHCEVYPKLDHGEALHRVVLWTIYLNDGFTEGETEFLYQQRKIEPRAGSLLIAPTSFTHTHRGNRPLGGDKYIATSWILFRRAESLYAPPAAGAAR